MDFARPDSGNRKERHASTDGEDWIAEWSALCFRSGPIIPSLARRMKEREREPEPRRKRVSFNNTNKNQRKEKEKKPGSGKDGATAQSVANARVIVTSNKPMIGLFERQIEALGSAPFALSFKEIFEVLVTHAAPETDKACQVFARTLQWPVEEEKMSEQVRFGVCLRLQCARDYCEHMAESEERDEPLRERQDKFIEELLTVYWYEAGREEWFMKQVCPVNNAEYQRLMKKSLYSMIWKDVTRRN